MEYSHSEMYIAININENRRDNQEKTMERHWKDQAQKTQDEEKQMGGGETHTHTHTTYDETHQIPEMNQGACKG